MSSSDLPPNRGKTRTWLWASLTAIVFLGAGAATIAWASESASDHSPTRVSISTPDISASPTGTTRETTPTDDKPQPPSSTVLENGELGAIAVVGDSLSVQSTNDQRDLLAQDGFGPIVIDAQHLRRIPWDSSTPPPYSGIAAVRDIRSKGDDPHTWVVELGTNDVGTTGDNELKMVDVIDTMLDEIGPGHRVVWVNIHQGQQPERTVTFNRVLAEIADGRADMVVADWASVAETKGYLIEDLVHLTVKGARAFAEVIADAAAS